MAAATESVVIGLVLSVTIYLLVGYYAYRKTLPKVEDFFTASRSFGTFFTVFTLGASLYSMWFFLGAAGFYYHHGMGWTANVTSNLLIGSTGIIIGVKIWKLSIKYKAITHAEILGRLFKSETLRIIAALTGIIFQIPYIALQIKGAGFLVASGTQGQIAFFWGTVIFFGLVTAYTFIGGQRSVVWADAIQGFVLLLGALFLAYITFDTVTVTKGTGFFQAVQQISPESLTLPGPSKQFTYTWYVSIVLLFGLGFGMYPFINSRYFIVKQEKTLWRSAPWAALWMGIGLYIPLFAGFAGVVLFPGLKGSEADNVLPMILAQFAPWATIILIMGAYAAALSSVSAKVLSIGAIVTRDFVQKVPGRREEINIIVSRISVVGASLLAFILAHITTKALIELGIMATAGVLQLLVPTVAAFWWQGRVHKEAVIVGTLVGLAIVILDQTGVYKVTIPVHAGIVALIINFLVFGILQLIFTAVKGKPDTGEIDDKIGQTA